MGIRNLGNSNAKQNDNAVQNDNRRRDNDRRDNDRRDDAQNDRDSIRAAFGGINAATKNTFGERSNPTRALSSLATYTKEYIKAKVRDKNSKWDVVIVEQNVAVPSVVIVSLNETKDADDKPYTVVVGHPIMLVDYDIRPRSLEDAKLDNKTYQQPTVWADAMDDQYYTRLEDALVAQLELKNFEYVKGGQTTIAFSEVPTDKISGSASFQDSRLDNLIFTVLTGTEAMRAIAMNETGTNLRPELLDRNASIVADINLDVNSSKTPTGLPVAEDFMIRVRETKGNNRYRDNRDDRPRSLNDVGVNNEEFYGGVSGRIDFSIVESRYEAGDFDGSPRIEDAACAVPEFVISSFDVYDRAPSLPMLLQLVSSVGILDTRNPKIFLQAFNPQNIVNTPSRNLGAISAELQDIHDGKFLERCEFRSNTGDDTIRKFARGAILDGSRISIEVPSQGPLTGLLDIFYRAAEYAYYGDKELAGYNDLLINAANILTDGEFGKNWNSNDCVMAADLQTVPGGYWMDDAGEKRDTRELGYLFYANLENPKEALDMSREYVGTFYEEDPIIAAAIRKDLISEIKGNGWVQTDNYKRCSFSDDFIYTLNAALRASGLSVASPNVNFGGRGDERRRVDDRRGFISSNRLEGGYNRYRNDGYRRNDRRDDRRDDRRGNGYRRNRR